MRIVANVGIDARNPAARRGTVETLERRRLLSTVVVNTLADEIYPPTTGLISLRSAVDDADASSTPTTITFDPTVFATPQTLAISSSLTLTGSQLTTITGPAAELTISGGGGNFIVLSIDQGVPVDFSSFTVADGSTGIAINGDSTLNDIISTGNSGDGISGGAVGNETSVFNDVTAENNGGNGIINEGTLTLNTVTASNNGGDGILNTLNGTSDEGDITASDVTAQNNGGRGIDNGEYAAATITDSTMSQNSGGGFANGGEATLEDDTIADNSASQGGGILSTAAADTGRGSTGGGLTLINDTIASNSAVNTSNPSQSDGGGIYNDGIIQINDVTISGNSAEDSGGGVFNSSPLTFNIANTIDAQNSILTSGGGTGPDFSGDVTSAGYNLIGESDGGGPWLSTDLTGTAAVPLSADLGGLADNGGSTETLLPGIGSPAIDHGSNSLVPTGVTTDQRGLPRIYNGTVDLGSVEAQAAPGASIVVSAPAAQEAALGVSQSFSLGSFTAADATAPYTVDVNWGDGTAVQSFAATAAGTIAPASHAYASGGIDHVTVTVTDASGYVTGSAGFAVTVDSLVLTPPAGQSAVIDTAQAFALGSFTATGGIGPYSVAVSWGDGTANTVLTLAAAGPIPASSHLYAAGGTATVTEAITDAGGRLSGTCTFSVTVTTGAAASSLSVTASGSGSVAGSPVVLTATVMPPSATGIVTFLAGGAVLGSADIGSGGIATLTTTGLGSGTSYITASYGGSAVYGPSNSTALAVKMAAPPATTTLDIQLSSGSINSSQSVTLTATAAPAIEGGAVVGGTVTFYADGAILGTATMQANGVAVFVTTAGLAVGTDSITAAYGGNANFAGSTSAASTIIVVPTVSQTILSVSSKSATIAQTATLTATIEPELSTPTSLPAFDPAGTVTFTDGGTAIGTATVGPGGVATLNVTGELLVGINAVVAVYSGSASCEPSTSAAGTFVDVTSHALVPAIRKVVVPATVIGGSTSRGSVAVQLTNELSNVEAGAETGYFAVHVFASLTTTLDVAEASLVGEVLRKAKVGLNQDVNVTVPITGFPPGLASGTYHLLVQTIDSMGNTETIDTQKTVIIVAPSINLAAAFVAVPANVLAKGAVLSITNSGNSNDLSTFTAKIGFSTDASGQDNVATGTGSVTPSKLLVRVGKATRLRLSGWKSLASGLAAGSYFLTLTLTDTAGHSVSVVSSKSILV